MHVALVPSKLCLCNRNHRRSKSSSNPQVPPTCVVPAVPHIKCWTRGNVFEFPIIASTADLHLRYSNPIRQFRPLLKAVARDGTFAESSQASTPGHVARHHHHSSASRVSVKRLSSRSRGSDGTSWRASVSRRRSIRSSRSVRAMSSSSSLNDSNVKDDVSVDPLLTSCSTIQEILPDGNIHSFETLQEREDFWLTWRHFLPLHRVQDDDVAIGQSRTERASSERLSTSRQQPQTPSLVGVSTAIPIGFTSKQIDRSERGTRNRADGDRDPNRWPSVYPFIRLQMRATPITQVAPGRFRDGWVSLVARAMRKAMTISQCSALAAPQIGIGSRMIALRKASHFGGSATLKPRVPSVMSGWGEGVNDYDTVEVLINPRVLFRGKMAMANGIGSDTDASLPLVRVSVRRPSWVVVQARSVDDRTVIRLFCEQSAESFGRAMDYLDGLLTVDVATPESRKMAAQSLRSLERKAVRFSTWHPLAARLALHNWAVSSATGKTEENDTHRAGDVSDGVPDREVEGRYKLEDMAARTELSTTSARGPTLPSNFGNVAKKAEGRVSGHHGNKISQLLPRVDHLACVTAYHEAGHAILGKAFPDHVRVEGIFLEQGTRSTSRSGVAGAGAAGFNSATLRPCTRWSGGTEIAFLVSDKDVRTLTIERMSVWLGGLVSEELMFGRADLYNGQDCSGSFADDLVHVSRTARRYLDACRRVGSYESALHALFSGDESVGNETHVEQLAFDTSCVDNGRLVDDPLEQLPEIPSRFKLDVNEIAADSNPSICVEADRGNRAIGRERHNSDPTGTTCLSSRAISPRGNDSQSRELDRRAPGAEIPHAASISNLNDARGSVRVADPGECREMADLSKGEMADWSRGARERERRRPLGLPRDGPYDSTFLAMVDEAYEIGRSILVSNVDKLHDVASLLMDTSRVEEHEMESIYSRQEDQ